jgi:hypothetical protein
MPNDPVKEALDRATDFCQRLQDLIVNKGAFTIKDQDGPDWLSMAHWSLVMDYQKSILVLVLRKYYGGAFALLRLIIEAQLRAFVVVVGSDEDRARIMADKYKINFRTIGAEIDAKYFQQFPGYFGPFLKVTIKSLHSYTHSGREQLRRRFDASGLDAKYTENEITDVIQLSVMSTWWVTFLVLQLFGHTDEAKMANDWLQEWAKHLHITGVNTLSA